jgi:hypothetical protein
VNEIPLSSVISTWPLMLPTQATSELTASSELKTASLPLSSNSQLKAGSPPDVPAEIGAAEIGTTASPSASGTAAMARRFGLRRAD